LKVKLHHIVPSIDAAQYDLAAAQKAIQQQPTNIQTLPKDVWLEEIEIALRLLQYQKDIGDVSFALGIE
jgi:hypothetical protein